MGDPEEGRHGISSRIQSVDMNRRAHKSSVILTIAVAAAFLLGIARPAQALVLHPGGEPNLAAWTDRPPKNVIGRWGNNASCVAVSPNCVLTTRHQGGGIGRLVEIDGVKYPVTQLWVCGTADLRLARLHGANLPDFVDLYEQTDESGRQIVIGGCGVGAGAPLQTNSRTYGYEWADYASRALRMGTNRIEDAAAQNELEGFTTDIVLADFDTLGSASSTAYESIPAAYDSGGGWFIKTADEWKLAGLTRAVESHFEAGHENDPNYILYQSWFRKQDDPILPDPDTVDAVRISSYAQWINNALPGVLPGDLNGDDHVDAVDFSIFALHWRGTDCRPPDWCLGADSEPDGDLDALDLADFARHWLDTDPAL